MSLHTEAGLLGFEAALLGEPMDIPANLGDDPVQSRYWRSGWLRAHGKEEINGRVWNISYG